MPKLTFGETVTMCLPSIAGAELIVKKGLSAGEFEKVNKEGEGVGFIPLAMSFMIVDWNLEGDDGIKLPITLENVKKIDLLELTDCFNDTDFGKKIKELQEKKTVTAPIVG